LLGYSDLEVGKIFNNKNNLVNAAKWWHIAHSVEYRVQRSNSTFIQLQCVQAPECNWYLHGGFHKRSDLYEITKLKRPHIYTSIFILKEYHQLNANFINNAISTLVMNNFSMMVASIQNEIKLHYKYKISYDRTLMFIDILI
jgi:hypothetical protein